MEIARELDIPLIIDGDGLWALNTNLNVVRGFRKTILTPNIVEYKRLCEKIFGDKSIDYDNEPELIKSICNNLGNLTIVKKGKNDIISDGDVVLQCDYEGSPRRCGGQGDILAGTIGTFITWQYGKLQGHKNIKGDDTISPTLLASYAGCALVRCTTKAAYEKYKRSMVTGKVLDFIGESFENLFSE